MRRATFIAYFVLLHGILALVLWKSDFLLRVQQKLVGTPPRQEITEHYKRMLRYHVRMDGNVPHGSVVFMGDRLTQGLFTDAVASPSVNFGIGSDTTVGVLARLPEYRQSLQHASAVVLAIGVNDMGFRDNQQIVENYKRILQALPDGVTVVCSAVLPVNDGTYGNLSVVNNARITDLNTSLKAFCSANPQCIFVDPRSRLIGSDGSLSAALEDGDGIHLNSAGNRIWIDELRNGLSKAQPGGPANGSQPFRTETKVMDKISTKISKETTMRRNE
jgi:lysophospholipase L1-like esterase